jgi:ribonucleoside-diphosphate reductase alpha chain
VGAPSINHDTLRAKGFDDEGLARLEAAIEGAFEPVRVQLLDAG